MSQQTFQHNPKNRKKTGHANLQQSDQGALGRETPGQVQESLSTTIISMVHQTANPSEIAIVESSTQFSVDQPMGLHAMQQ